MKVLNIYFFIFALIIIIFSIYNLFSNNVENYVNYDTNQYQENCVDYINSKNWSVDYGLSFPNTEEGNLLSQSFMKDRMDVISGLTTVKSPQYSIWGQQFVYSDACLLQKENLKLYDAKIDTCNIQGKSLSKDSINDFGRKAVLTNNVKLYTPKEFASVSTLNVSTMKPKKGCLIDTRDKDRFFKLIDELVAVKKFDRDNIINLKEVEKNKSDHNFTQGQELNKQQQQQIANLNSYVNKIELTEQCRNITIAPSDIGNGSLEALNNQDISCSQNEVLQKVQLNTTTIPYINVRYHTTRKNAFLISNKDPKAFEFLSFLKINPTATFRITNLLSVADSQIDKCSDWGCTCQGFSDKFRTGHNQGWGHCPTDGTGQWWIDHGCTTTPSIEESPCKPWGCTCQGMSDLYGTWHNVTWGDALYDHIAQQWWGVNSCNTKPDMDGELCKPWGCTCQGITDKYKTRHNITWGKATDKIKNWWMQHACHTGNITELIYDPVHVYSFNGVEEFTNEFTWVIYSGGQELLPEQCVANIDVIIGDGKKLFHNARCCSINTNIGDNVRFKIKSNDNETTKINPRITSNIWDARSLYSQSDTIQSGPKCNNNLLNKYKIESDTIQKKFNYKYSCSDIENDIIKTNPNKNIDITCSKHYTEPSNIINGKTTEMRNMNIECPPKSYISDIKLNKNGDSYRTEYTCCAPTMQH